VRAQSARETGSGRCRDEVQKVFWRAKNPRYGGASCSFNYIKRFCYGQKREYLDSGHQAGQPGGPRPDGWSGAKSWESKPQLRSVCGDDDAQEAPNRCRAGLESLISWGRSWVTWGRSSRSIGPGDTVIAVGPKT